MNNDKEDVEELRKEIKSMKEKIDDLSQKIDKIYDMLSEIRPPQLLRGEIALDYIRKKILDYIAENPEGVTARDIAKKFSMSRSHASAILNELHRNGLLKKVRVRREIKYVR